MATDNVELACCFIQKCAVEKAIPEMDRRLATVSHSGIGLFHSQKMSNNMALSVDFTVRNEWI